MLALRNLLLVNLWQAIHVIVVALDTEVLSQVDNLHVGRNRVLLQECLALSVSEAEEHHIHLVERHLRRELQLGLAQQALVYVIHFIPSV